MQSAITLRTKHWPQPETEHISKSQTILANCTSWSKPFKKIRHNNLPESAKRDL